MSLPSDIESLLKKMEAKQRDTELRESAQVAEDAREERLERKRHRRAKEILQPLLTSPEFAELSARAVKLGMSWLPLGRAGNGWAAMNAAGEIGLVEWVKYGGPLWRGPMALPEGWAEDVLALFESGGTWQLIEWHLKDRLRQLRMEAGG